MSKINRKKPSVLYTAFPACPALASVLDKKNPLCVAVERKDYGLLEGKKDTFFLLSCCNSQ